MINKIKAEIGRLKVSFRDNPSFRTVRSETAKEFADNLLSFIESLEKEQEVNLEKEIYNLYDGEYHDTEDVARHFYELGLNARKEESL